MQLLITRSRLHRRNAAAALTMQAAGFAQWHVRAFRVVALALGVIAVIFLESVL